MEQTHPEKRGRGRPRYDQQEQEAAATFRRIGAGFRLERDRSAPLWVQLRNQIEDAIRDGGLAPKSRLPSEQALCEIFDISRPVVRSAISALASEGLVIKIPRKGLFVAGPRLETGFITSNFSVFSDMTARGHDVTVKTFDFRKTAADLTEQRVFGLPESGQVIRIGRVYYTDGNPLTFTQISLPAHRVPGMETLDMENQSVFGTIRTRYGLSPHRAERWFTAAMPSDEAVELMGVPASEPMIWIESIAYDADGGPLEFYRAFYNSAVSRLHITIGP